jgi:hypothetical protein
MLSSPVPGGPAKGPIEERCPDKGFRALAPLLTGDPGEVVEVNSFRDAGELATVRSFSLNSPDGATVFAKKVAVVGTGAGTSAVFSVIGTDGANGNLHWIGTRRFAEALRVDASAKRREPTCQRNVVEALTHDLALRQCLANGPRFGTAERAAGQVEPSQARQASKPGDGRRRDPSAAA